MKNRTAIHDYLLYSALIFKAIAIFITWYAFDRYDGLLYESNFLTRILLQHNIPHFLVFQLAVFTFICAGYHMVRREYLVAYRKRTTAYLFSAMVGFVFLIYLLDAANDTIVLLVATLS